MHSYINDYFTLMRNSEALMKAIKNTLVLMKAILDSIIK